MFAAVQDRSHLRKESIIMKDYKIMIVGVGGQGTLLASKLLGKMFLNNGYDVKVSEVHGMSQRGGSVVTYVCAGEKAWSPVIDKGEADLIVSFELLEAARWADYLKKDGTIVVNTQEINPMPVITGAASYPADIIPKLNELGIKTDAFDALSPAVEAGSAKAVNMVLMGRLSNYFEFSADEWLTAMETSVPEKFIELNKKAFTLGRKS